MNNVIEKWLASEPKDYEEGCRLVQEYYEPRTLAKNIADSYRKGLPLYKMASLTDLLRYISSKSGEQKACVTATKAKEDERVKEKGERAFAADPSIVIDQAKQLMESLWVRIGKIHKKVYDLGTANNDATMRKRARLLADEEEMQRDYSLLFELKEAYFKTGELDGRIGMLVGKWTGNNAPEEHAEEEFAIPDTEAELTLLHKKVLRRLNERKRRLADMPDGPKRETLVAAIAKDRRELEATDRKIEELKKQMI